MCGGMKFTGTHERVVLTERVHSIRLSGRLRAIADREQGTLWDAEMVRGIAKECFGTGAVASAAFWHAYADEAEKELPEPYPVRQCPVCRTEIVPAVPGTMRLICPVCDPFTVRDVAPETAKGAEA